MRKNLCPRLSTIWSSRLADARLDPEDDLWPLPPRVIHHFYDPVRKIPLTNPFIPFTKKRSPDWGMGSTDVFTQPNTPDANRDNHYSFFDAREAMYRALTGQASDGTIDIGPNNTPALEDERKAYWATTFRALGDVLHLVQDAAQPQHTRNDVHLLNGTLGKKAYENFTDLRVTQDNYKCFSGRQDPPLPVTYGGYPDLNFATFGEIFTTEAGAGGNVANGKGIADYSNRGFFSAGTNINDSGSSPYSLPVHTSEMDAVITNPCLPGGQFFRKKLLLGNVVDKLQTDPAYQASGVRLSSSGIWRTPDESEPGDVFENFGYALTRENYIDQGDLLLPRAVSYSAGMIDYFFRGRIALLRDVVDPTTYYIKNNSQETATGDFTLYYDATDGLRYAVPGATWTIASLAPDTKSAAVTFTPPTTPPQYIAQYVDICGYDGNVDDINRFHRAVYSDAETLASSEEDKKLLELILYRVEIGEIGLEEASKRHRKRSK